ncbi:hypothetical protein ABZ714_02230 [Streptomyces sp. NPDC006798]|uniref:hypothetical protein n=1 Tax=Streptomyces sp. NPDC006798 TaxID=3155462 RepID=UPI0033CC013D
MVDRLAVQGDPSADVPLAQIELPRQGVGGWQELARLQGSPVDTCLDVRGHAGDRARHLDFPDVFVE